MSEQRIETMVIDIQYMTSTDENNIYIQNTISNNWSTQCTKYRMYYQHRLHDQFRIELWKTYARRMEGNCLQTGHLAVGQNLHEQIGIGL